MSAPLPPRQPTLALIDELLAEQSRLQTPVAKFATAHESGSLSQLSALSSQLSRQLIPLTKPRPGEQYAFEVELDSCTGCKACVSACHSLNGLDDEETWRDVGLLVGGNRAHPFSQTVTTACHHCADPACLNGCPVLAYEKDPLTGIVRHLDDQCIGCQYCVLKCPYDVPKYSERLGIIRKCDMCHSRLAEGEAPACVQACPTSAIKIVTVITNVGGALRPDTTSFLPTAPDPSYTQPTTRYVTQRTFPRNLAPADAATLRPQHPHWPLVLMLTLLPAAVGLQLSVAFPLFVGACLQAIPSASAIASKLAPAPSLSQFLLFTAAALGALGLFASVFHLGQPLRAWRIFLGWRKSWLSREALVFGAWFALTALAAAAPFIPQLSSLNSQLSALNSQLLPTAAAALGSLGLFCSVMIYVDTRREFWRFAQTAPRFFGTAALFALAPVAPRAAAVLLAAKLAWESRTFYFGATSARLQRGPLARAVLTRDFLAFAAILVLILASPLVPIWVVFPLLLAGEIAERYLFFRAVDAPKMPGVPRMSTLEDILHVRTGPMTTELVQHPADYGLGLGRLPARLAPAATTNMVCGFCSTGCSLRVHLDAAGQAINLSADPDYPVNLGMACPKGWEALTPLAAYDRATAPLLRRAREPLARVDWSTALAAFTEKFKGIQREHGPHSIAFLSTGQIVMEEMALLGALFKFGMGALHCDSNTRQCMATSHVAYKQSFGFDAPPFTYADFEESDALIFVGANPCIAHPIMWQRVMMNKRKPEIVVVDPRATETAQAATLHVALRPKSDLTFLYGLAHLLIARGAVKRDFIEAHTNNYNAFATFVATFTPEHTAAETGVPVATLQRLVDIIATRERVSFWWTMGVNQSHEATRTAQAIINLALMTGNIGRPGTGANSITGQCNAMGSRLFGNATSLLGGYDVANPAHREHVAGILGLPPAQIPDRAGYAYDQILDAIERGEIRGLWVIATNTAHSWINQSRARDLLAKLDFLVVQDMYSTTETAQLADLVLPAAGWGEKDGVLINSERRLGVVKKVSRAPGQALSDFAIFKLVAEAWGCGDLFREWSSPEAAFQVLKKLSAGQPCDFTGIRDYAHISESRGIQWPFTASDGAASASEPIPANSQLSTLSSQQPAQQRRLFADGKFFTPDARARFYFDAPRPMAEPPDAAYPFIMLTGRGSSAQWHTGSRTDKSAVLRKLAPTVLTAEINPDDATRLHLTAGDRVTVRSRRGQAEAVAVITPTVQAGQIFLPMHFGKVNQLTFPSFDPHSRQPSYKACAVAVARVE